MSHEAVYTRVLCPRDKESLARHGIMLRSKRTRHQTQAASTWRVLRIHPIVGMVSSKDCIPWLRSAHPSDRGDGQHWLTIP